MVTETAASTQPEISQPKFSVTVTASHNILLNGPLVIHRPRVMMQMLDTRFDFYAVTNAR